MTENFQDQSSQGETEDIPQFEAWGRLISIGPNLKNVLLYQNIYSVGRKSSNKIIVKNEKISSIHCVFSRDQDGDCWLEDFSLNGIYIEGAKVGQGNQIKLLSGDLIHLLPPKKKKGEDIPGFIFSAKNNDPYKLKRTRYINEDNQESKQNDRRTHLGKEIMCKICDRFIYQCVTVNPCLHNFCAACISDWVQLSQNCPQCQQQLTAVKRNKTMNEIIDRYSQSNNGILRSQQECYDLDLRDKIKDQTIIIQKDINNHFNASNNVNESKSNSKRSHPHCNQNYKRGGSTKRGQGRYLRGRGGRGSRGGRGGRGSGVINLWNRESCKNDDYESRTMKMDEIDEDDCNNSSNYFENESDQDNEYNDANNDSEEDDRYTFFDEVEEGDLGDENQIEYPQRMEESTTFEDEIFSEKNMQS